MAMTLIYCKLLTEMLYVTETLIVNWSNVNLSENKKQVSAFTNLKILLSLKKLCLLIDLVVVTECPSGSHGYECLEDCQCQNGALCDPVNGACSCAAGWQGTFCEQGE